MPLSVTGPARGSDNSRRGLVRIRGRGGHGHGQMPIAQPPSSAHAMRETSGCYYSYRITRDHWRRARFLRFSFALLLLLPFLPTDMPIIYSYRVLNDRADRLIITPPWRRNEKQAARLRDGRRYGMGGQTPQRLIW